MLQSQSPLTQKKDLMFPPKKEHQKMHFWAKLPPTSWNLLLPFVTCHFSSFFTGTSCLRDLVLTVPPAVSLGDTIQLNCSYHLQGESLYAIKLYKGRDEFLTYAAERSPPLRTFPLKGIHLEVSYFHFYILKQMHVAEIFFCKWRHTTLQSIPKP